MPVANSPFAGIWSSGQTQNGRQMMNSEQAEIMAIRVVEWMATDRRTMSRFLVSTGQSLDDVSLRINEPDFLASALDFLLSNDNAIMAFCRDSGCNTSAPMAARQALPGGNDPHWT